MKKADKGEKKKKRKRNAKFDTPFERKESRCCDTVVTLKRRMG